MFSDYHEVNRPLLTHAATAGHCAAACSKHHVPSYHGWTEPLKLWGQIMPFICLSLFISGIFYNKGKFSNLNMKLTVHYQIKLEYIVTCPFYVLLESILKHVFRIFASTFMNKVKFSFSVLILILCWSHGINLQNLLLVHRKTTDFVS